jgi:hypothetical protein
VRGAEIGQNSEGLSATICGNESVESRDGNSPISPVPTARNIYRYNFALLDQGAKLAV